jgi:hypothetical protein
VSSDGSRFQVPAGPFATAYDAFAAYLRGAGAAGPTPASGSNLSHTLSAQLAAAALNVAYGDQDASSTIQDPAQNEWVPVGTLLQRVSQFIEANPTSSNAATRQTAETYARTLAALNGNTASVTPADPARCPAPF